MGRVKHLTVDISCLTNEIRSLMAGRTIDPKTRRITLRLSVNDLRLVQREADRQQHSVGLVIRKLIRDHLSRKR